MSVANRGPGHGARPMSSVEKYRARKAKKPPLCSCDEPEPQEDSGMRVCGKCGTVLSNINIVSEVTFGEASSGAAVVQGAFVGAGQRHAKSMGIPNRHMGGMGGDSGGDSISAQRGEQIVRQLCSGLRLSDNLTEKSAGAYRIIQHHNFVQGRVIEQVAGVCIYHACRFSKNKEDFLSLADISEKVHTSVYHLGKIYKDMCKTLGVHGEEGLLDLEKMVMRYAKKLEFGDMVQTVAHDAQRIMSRMKRDWITQGRAPAGVIGACLILAARMNNFRRSVREVVFVSKISEPTLNARMQEFKKTEASTLSIDEFRNKYDSIPNAANPPAIYRPLEKAEKKRKRMEQGEEFETPEDGAVEAEGEAPEGSNAGKSKSKKPRKRKISKKNDGQAAQVGPRRDADGYLIPDLPPVDPEILADAMNDGAQPQPAPKKRGRPRKVNLDVHPPTAEEAQAEAAVEQAIEAELNDPELQQIARDHEWNEVDERRAAELKATHDQMRSQSKVSNDIEVLEGEFEDDDEVKFCRLSDEEAKRKEMLWVTENADWLRAQHKREMEKQLQEAQGGPKKPIRRRKRRRVDENEDGTPTRPADAAEATFQMITRRFPGYSRKLNYEQLRSAYGGAMSPASDQNSGRSSVEGSPAPSSRATPSRLLAPAGDLEGAKAALSAARKMLPTPTPSQATRRSTQPLGGAETIAPLQYTAQRSKPQGTMEVQDEDEDEDEDEDMEEDGYTEAQAIADALAFASDEEEAHESDGFEEI